MARRSRTSPRRRGKTAEDVLPPWLRDRLVSHRLEFLALFRALDRLHLAQGPRTPELHELFELDADLAEALWALDQPARRFDLNAMLGDTLASLEAIPAAVRAFVQLLSNSERVELLPCVEVVLASLVVADAYLQIPGRDPTAS